ncbi:unnamed protein product [Heligmosomoides polygyrus]|uniref:Reverse transcriptase domain-containing protein n=1 Tax=Heligmosomoides polygyrus TaxID=6339 RepID=A0A183GRG6_HELPZ|nr:unnamed protein product [Heligmosomoides polygyrus]
MEGKVWHSAEWLAKFFNQVVDPHCSWEKEVPQLLQLPSDELERELQAWCDRLEPFGLRLNGKKAEYLTTDVTESSSIKVNDIELPRTSAFKYLGSAAESDGNLMIGVNLCVSAAWSKWQSLTGVLCDRKIPERLKSKIYRTVVRPVAMYGAEYWPATKEVETRLNVMETLRWTAGVARVDHIRNDAIRQTFGVAPIADKMREDQLQCYGHILSGKGHSVRKIDLNFEVIGKLDGGLPKQRWSDTIHMEMKVAGVHPDLALDRESTLPQEKGVKSERQRAPRWIPIYVGMHLGSALSPLLFVVVMDAISRNLQMAAPWTLLYAGNVILAREVKTDHEPQAQAWCNRLVLFGLKLNFKKTEYLTTDVNEHGSIRINGIKLAQATSFKYLGSTITSDGSLKLEVNARGSAAWSKWRSLTGVLCDRTIPDVMETKMLRWTAGVTRLDRVRNDTIRQRFGVAPIAEKLCEARLRWYGQSLALTTTPFGRQT